MTESLAFCVYSLFGLALVGPSKAGVVAPGPLAGLAAGTPRWRGRLISYWSRWG